MRLVARAPNHLGDGVMALPALRALTALGPLQIQAPPWGHALYADLGAQLAPPGPIGDTPLAVLFPPSFRAAWQARRARRRVGTPTDHRAWLLTDPVPEGPHRRDTYAALARAAGAWPSGLPRFMIRGRAPWVPAGHIGLNPVSVSGETVEWTGFRALADRLGRPAVFYGGPGEQRRVASLAGPHLQRVGLDLPAFAAALDACALFVSNDSGAAHFAAACGVPTLVVFGSTSASRTGPPGRAVRAAEPPPCAPCYRKRCAAVPRLACLAVSVEAVLAEVEAMLR